MTAIKRHRAAISRYELSRPMRVALEDGLLTTSTSVFDYGCGRGDDLRRLKEKGISCDGWDPVFRPRAPLASAEIVNLGYVVNVIENEEERAQALKRAWELATRALIVSTRLTSEASLGTHSVYEDGYLTRLGTFQKYFEQHELRDWIDRCLEVSSIAAAPGIFYVFRDESTRQDFLASRYRTRITVPRQRRSELLFDRHRAILEALASFVANRGRLPDESEFEHSAKIHTEVGSIRRAFEIVQRVTGRDRWKAIREIRSQDLLVYLALSAFSGRPIFSRLSRDLQIDVKAFFSTYSRATGAADRLLFSAGDDEAVDAGCVTSSIGKLTPNALYVHSSGLEQLPAVLRVYEGCARALVGSVDVANIVKLHRRRPQISYLAYPDFDQDPHPALHGSLIVNLRSRRIRMRDYRQSTNPFILHRKEQFVPEDYPGRHKFANLTKREESLGLLDDTQNIGTLDAWNTLLKERHLQTAGHRLLHTVVEGET